MPEIGEKAPDFALRNQDGETVRLSDYLGQKVVLFAFPKAESGGCTTQACAYRDELPDIQAHNAVVLGISPDSPETLKRWKEKRHLQYDLLSDPEHAVLTSWNSWGIKLFGLLQIPMALRSYWIIDEQGVIIDAQLGVGPKDSVAKTLAALEKVDGKAAAAGI